MKKNNQNTQPQITQQLEAYASDPKNGGFVPVVDDDPLINLFNYCKTDFYYEFGNIKEMTQEERNAVFDEYRLKYDGDSHYYNELLGDPQEALKGDTITSFYTPYKEMIKRKTGRAYHRKRNPFDELIAKRNDEGFKEVNDKFSEFASLNHTPGNYMLLPSREMNCSRYQSSEDRIDKSLYECFPGGALAKYFGEGEEEQLKNLTKWVKEQKLTSLFENGEIAREKIIPFNPQHPFATYSEMTDEEMYEFLDKAVALMKLRNEN
jgi:hypothetical protein